MEHRKKKTGGFNLERFRVLLIKAIGNRTQGKFAEDSGISRITINRLLTLDDVPRPSLKTISNITSASNASIPSIEFYDACGYTYTEYRQSERSKREKMPFPERAAAILQDIEDAVSEHPTAESIDELSKFLRSRTVDNICMSIDKIITLPIKKRSLDSILCGNTAMVVTASCSNTDKVYNRQTRIEVAFLLTLDKKADKLTTEYIAKDFIRNAGVINDLGYKLEGPDVLDGNVLSYSNIREYRLFYDSTPIECYASYIERKIPLSMERTAESSKGELMSDYFVIPVAETVSLPTTQINYGIPLAGISNSVLLKYIISNSRHIRLSTMGETEELLAVLKEGTENEVLAALKAVNLNPAEAICRIINVKLTSNLEFATLLRERKQILYSFVDPGTKTRHGIHNNDDGIFAHPIVRYCSNQDYKEGILPPVIIADEYYTSTLNLETPITNQLIKVVKVLTGEPFLSIVASYDVMKIPKDDIATCPRMI